MPAAKPEFATLDIPLGAGLAQKHDPRLLPLGQSATATNIVVSKQGAFQKTPGFTTLGNISPSTGIAPLAISRLATKNENLLTVATDNAFGGMSLWSRQEAGDQLLLTDRISEAYIPPTDGVLTLNSSPLELDTCVDPSSTTPYELHVGLWSVNGGFGAVYYSVTQATLETNSAQVSRAVVIQPTPVPPLASISSIAPKVIILNGGTAILTVHSGTSIFAVTMDLTQPWLGWSVAVTLATDVNPNVHGVYDTSIIDDDGGAAFVLAYESQSSGTNAITVRRFATTLNQLAVGTFTDATWSGSGQDLRCIACRASVADGAVWLAYAYQTGTVAVPVANVRAGAIVYPGLASNYSNSTDITGGASTNAYPCPQGIDIKESAQAVNGQLQTQQVVWSPTTLPPGTNPGTFGPPVLVGSCSYNSASGLNCCAIYQSAVYPAGGGAPFTTTLHPNQPRVTPNLVLASRMAVVANGTGKQRAYLCGWIPSNETIPGSTSLTMQVGNPGAGYAPNGVVYAPFLTFTGGGGSGAAAQAVIDPNTGTIVAVTVINPGAGYTSNPTVHLNFGSPPNNVTYTVDGLGNGTITGLASPYTGGSGFGDATHILAPGAVPLGANQDPGFNGSGFAGYANIDPNTFQITGITITNRGTGYGASTLGVLIPGQNGVITATVPARQRQNVQGTFYLLCMDTFTDVVTPQTVPLRLCGIWKPRLAQSGMFANNHVLPHLVTNPNGSSDGSLFQTDLPINVSPNVAASTVCSFDLASEYAYQSGELGAVTGLASGLPAVFDGSRCGEFCFPYYPENVVVTSQPAGNISPGTYSYIAIYTRRDQYGNVYRSGRSVAQPIVLDTTNLAYGVNVRVPTMSISTAQRGVPQFDSGVGIGSPPAEFIEIYRTTNGGTTYYNISSSALGSTQNVQLPNGLNAPFTSFTDIVGDADLQNNAKLYGDGLDGVVPGSLLDNLCPPPFQGLIVHKNRWWGFDGNQVWYSKAFTQGEGPGFNEQFAFSVDDGPGPITALASMDERLIIFKRDRILYVTGDGPADNGTQQDLQPPQRIQSDVGCLNWRSVISAPTGIWFQSDNGLYLLTRKYEVQPAGKFVEDTLATYPDLTSGTLDMRNGLLVWSANGQIPFQDGHITEGILLLYNWVLDCWTVQQITPARGNPPGLVSACLSGPNLAYTVTDGGVTTYRQTTGTGAGSYMIAGAYQPFIWESPWIRPPSVQGWMRAEMAHMFWQSLDAHQLSLQIAYNYSNTYTETWTVSATAQANVTTPLIQWDFQPTHPQVESIRFKVTDAADATIPPVSGQGPLLIGCTLEYADLGGTFRKSVTQRGSA
jgi:hypothetical protein